MVSQQKEVVPVRPDTILECPKCGRKAAIDSGLFKLNPGQTTIQTVRICRRCGNGHPRVRAKREKVDYVPPDCHGEDREALRRRLPHPGGYLRSLAFREFPERVAKLRRLIEHRDRGIKVKGMHSRIVDAATDIVDMTRFIYTWSSWGHVTNTEPVSYGRWGKGAMSVATARKILRSAERRLQRMRREPA